MTLKLDDRIQETSVTSGTGTLTLDGAVVSFRPFSTLGNGNTTYYAIVGAVEWEVGQGTYNAGTLTRDIVFSSSNANNLVNFTAETKSVFVDYPASIAAAASGGGVASFNTRTGAVTLLDTDVTGALGATAVTNAVNATNAGNATTVTNGVYTTGSYSNPTWITGLDYGKLTGTVPTWNQNTTGSAASATTATNIAGGVATQIPYQTSIGSTSFITAPTVASFLQWNGTGFTWANPAGAGTVTSVGGTGTVSGLSLSGTVTTSGNLTLGGTLNLSSPPAIGGTTPAAVTATNLKVLGGTYAEGVFGGTYVDGIVVDYDSGSAVGRISVGGADGLNFYNGGIAGSLLGSVSNNGDWSLTRFLDVGNGSLIGGSTNPIIAAAGSANQYVQSYIHNDNSGTSASADLAAYPDNGTDASGWIDMGITSSTYNDVAYPITGANEGYIFMSAPSGAGKTGNLVYATDSTGSQNYHQWYVGGFGTAKSSWKMQLNDTNLTLALPFNSTVTTGTAPFTVSSTTNVANLNASSLNGATFAAPGAIGGTTASAITGTTITANTAFAGALNGSVGATTPSTGAFTTLSASSTVSGTGFSTYLASPPAIGGTTAAAGAFTTLSASSTVSGTGFSTYLASPPAIGGTAAAAGTFTQLTVNGTNLNTTISPTGTGTVTISPVGALTVNPTAASTINNTSIGATTASTGRFSSAIITAGNGTTVPLQFTSGTNLATAAAGGIEYDGSSFYSSVASATRGVMRTEQMVVLNTAYTLTSQTAAQKLFNATTNGAVTLPIGTYQFECFYSLSAMSATSGSFGFAMVAGTAVIGSQGWWSIAEKGTATLATATAGQLTYNTAANTTIATASTNTVGYASIRGIIKITTAGTVVPSVSLGVAAAAAVGINSYFKISPITGASAANIFVGNWS